MSSYYIGEDDSFTNINESFASAGTNSLASTSSIDTQIKEALFGITSSWYSETKNR
ncbi:10375_t:CDS:2 [Entrophospora sp. SA101]|nr:10375_t:CDS:2 [Entrophospora sp. SA101]